MSEESILREIEQNESEFVEFFRDLIKTKSYNPPGNEKDVALKIEKYLKDAGVKCELFEMKNNRANLIAYLNDNFEGKNLLYNGHMDVVPPGDENEWKYPPLSATIKRKKYIYGRGTADMKGGTAAMAVCLKILKKLDFKCSGNLIFNAVADEETGGHLGTEWCLQHILKSFKCHFAVVGEPTQIKPISHAILLGEKGRIQLKIITNGISCHASAPFLGKNAVYMMSEIIQNIDKLDEIIPNVEPPIPLDKLKTLMSVSFPNEEAFQRIYKEQPLLSNTTKALTQFTKTLTMIKGGIKENVVPDRCEAKMDFRLLPGQTFQTVINALTRLINDLGYPVKQDSDESLDEPNVYLEIEEASEASYWNDWESSDEVKRFYDIVEKIYEKKPFYFLFPATTDAKHLRNTGYCPQTIDFGPGNAPSAHSIDENIEIKDFLNAIKVYALFACDFLK